MLYDKSMHMVFTSVEQPPRICMTLTDSVWVRFRVDIAWARDLPSKPLEQMYSVVCTPDNIARKDNNADCMTMWGKYSAVIQADMNIPIVMKSA